MSSEILVGPPIGTPIPQETLGQLFFNSALKNGEKICQVDGTADTSETYSSVLLRSTRVAIALEKKGVTLKDVVAFCTGNSLDAVIPIFATFYLGAKVANLEPSLSVRQTQHLIGLVSPKVIFVEESSVGLIEDSVKGSQAKPEIIVYGKSDKYTTLEDMTVEQENENSFRPSSVDLNEVALIFFSSGTTGLPKAICHTHKSFMNIGCAVNDYNMGEAVLHFSSFYWVTANFMLIGAMMAGGRRVFLRTVDPEATFKTIEKHKVNTIFLAPVLVNKLINFSLAKQFDLSSVNIVSTAGTPVSSTQQQNLAQTFKQASILQWYGLTEIGIGTAFHPDFHEEFIRKKPQSCGAPFFGTKIKIVDLSTEKALGLNQKGEMRFLTPGLFKGYYNTDSSDCFDSDGFLKTEDIGYYDEDGCLYVIERIKEMFKYQSWHIVPSAIEAVLLEHPAVKETAVFGVPCGDDGEVPGACIVLKNGTTVTKEEIEDFVAERVSDREKLRGGVYFVGSLIKTPTGKVMRREIRDSVLKTLQY